MEKRFLITRWLKSHPQPIPIYDEASVSSARQRVREAGQKLNLSREFVENVALMASELSQNQLSHSKQGYFAVEPILRAGVKGLEITAADIGPGIVKPGHALKDDFSTKQGLGAGLGAVGRLADEIEFDNRLSEGVLIVARKFESLTASLCTEIAVMGQPHPGESVSGDDAVFLQSESAFLAAVLDGLGHGPEARKASNRAVELISDKRSFSLAQILMDMDRELASTRGCAVCIARFDKSTSMLECASFGDVHAHLYTLKNAHFFTATPLVIGSGQLRNQRIRIETTTVPPRSVLVVFTDGLKSKTNLKGQLDVLRQPMIGVAQHLLENDARPDDDALVLVGRFTQ